MIFQTPALPAQYAEVIEKIDQLRNQLRYTLQQQPKRWTGLLRRSTLARNMQASNSIEGFYVTIEDAIAAVDNEEPLEEKSEAWAALQGYRSAMSYILQLADDPHYTHNEGTIRSLHYMMIGHDIRKNPGRWRPGSIHVRREPSNEIVYEGPNVELVPALIEELIRELNAETNTPVQIRAAMAHLNLVMIHPFSDGNGRMARALQTMVLAREGILDPNFSSIEEYLGRVQQEYYGVLGQVGRGAWHPGNDALPWIKFCLTAHFRQAETLQRRFREAHRMWEEIEIELKRRGLNERMILALADAGAGYRLRNVHYRSSAEISDQVASRDLAVLVEHGLLVPRGEKRGRYYVAGEWLTNLRRNTREDKIVTDPFSETTVTIYRQDFLPGLETSKS